MTDPPRKLPTMKVGDKLPDHVQGPISRATLALFAGASNDYVPLHIDSDFAKSAGMTDVFAPGMLSMAYLGQMLTTWVPQERLRSWSVRFTAITPLYATVTCRGTVMAILEFEGEPCARLEIGAYTDQGVQTLAGEAIVALK